MGRLAGQGSHSAGRRHGPDLMQINWNWIESYSGNGTNFANLEDYSDVLDLTQFPSDSLELCKADGKLMAVPVALTGRLFYWNKTTFDEVNVAIPTDEASLFAAGEAFNIGAGGREYLIDVYYELCKALGKETEPLFGPPRAGDIRDSNADIGKARELLGYNPEYDFAAGIALAIDWYKENLV